MADADHAQAVAVALLAPIDVSSRGVFDRLVAWLRALQERVQDQAEVLEVQGALINDLRGRVAAWQAELGTDEQALGTIGTRVGQLEQQVAALSAAIESLVPGDALSIVVTLNQGDTMPGTAISIDSTTAKATFAYLDDHGDTDANPPLSADGGAVTVTLVSDNPAVATLAADPSDPTGRTFDITPVAEGGIGPDGGPDGSVNVVVTATDDTGAPAVFADGQPVTALPTPFGIKAGDATSLAVVTTA